MKYSSVTLTGNKPLKNILISVALSTGIIFSDGVSAVIKVGMSTVLDGPAKGLGLNVKLGVETYFNSINAMGGIKGEFLELIALDDGYEPGRAAPNMRQLIKDENIVSVIGNVGTPTAIVTVPIANAEKTLLFGAVTGAGVLRQTPPDRYIINYRASYAEETAAMIDGLLSVGIKPEEIAFFTQKDGYGDAGYNGGIKALRATGFQNVASLVHGRYQRNTINVEGGLAQILDADIEPRAIIMVGAYKPCAAFIKLAKEDFPDVLFLNVSFVGSIPLMRELGDQTDNVVVTQVVPHYNDDLPATKDFRDHLKQYKPGAEPGFMALEGYLMAKVFVEGLRAINGEVNRESVVDGLLGLRNLDIGIGNRLSFADDEYQVSHGVWPTWIKNGEYVPLNWTDLK